MLKQLDQQESHCVDVTQRTGWALKVNFASIPAWMHDKKFGVWVAEPRENGKVNKAPRHPYGGWKLSCWRRLNFDHLCRLNLDQGLLLV